MADNILLLGCPDNLTRRLAGLGVQPVRANSLEEAVAAVGSLDPPVRAVLLSPEPPVPDLAPALTLLQERSLAADLCFIVVGPYPDPAQTEPLRRAGVRLALWEPFHDGELRFVVNHALYNPKRGESRLEPRVPTRLAARVLGGAVEKVARVYNLSVGGAYLETDRPTPVGGEVFVELALPSRITTIQAMVVSNNVPGNLERAQLPRGMGVEFLEMDEATLMALAGFLEECARRYQL